MQNGKIAGAFAAWQRAHQKLMDAEQRLQAALELHQQGRAPSPDALRQEVLGLKAEQDWRFDAAADALRSKHAAGTVPPAHLPASPGSAVLPGY